MSVRGIRTTGFPLLLESGDPRHLGGTCYFSLHSVFVSLRFQTLARKGSYFSASHEALWVPPEASSGLTQAHYIQLQQAKLLLSGTITEFCLS